MLRWASPSKLLRHLGPAARATAGAAAGMALLASAVLAQQAPAPAGKADPKAKPKAAAPAAKGAKGAGESVWVKLCEIVPTGTIYKDGKEQTMGSSFCLTQHETLDGKTGRAIVSAAVRQMEGESKQYFMAMVPVGIMVKPGMRIALYPKDAWEQMRKNEKLDESKLKGLALEYTMCNAAGCTAQAEATPELINDLKSFGGFLIFAVNAVGEATPYPVPLTGFGQAYTGAGMEAKKYAEGRKALALQLEERQRALAEQAKKQPPAEQKAAPAKK